jgi:sulfite exporter TauE/SafE
VWRRVQPLTRALLPPRHAGAALALGALWGLLPCGLIYSSLGWAAATGDAVQGGLLMAAFGLGTLPAMALTTCGGVQLQRRLRRPAMRRGIGAVLIAFGIASALLPWWHTWLHTERHTTHAGGAAQHHHPAH